MRLGRLPHDVAALAEAPRHRFAVVQPPRVLDRSSVELIPGLYGNDRYPDCTAVALANAARGVAALNEFGLVIDSAKPLAFYGSCVGDPPNLAATDGAVMLDVLDRQCAKGFDVGPQELVGRYGVLPHDRTTMALAMARLGTLYLGVTLYERDMQLVDTSKIWDVADGRDDGQVVGGHAVFAWDYDGRRDTDTVRLGTWGAWQRATWSWLEHRLDEAYAVVWRQLARADGTFYDGVSPDGLVEELGNAIPLA